MFKKTIVGLLAVTGTAAIAVTVYTILKERQRDLQTEEDGEVHFIDITNGTPVAEETRTAPQPEAESAVSGEIPADEEEAPEVKVIEEAPAAEEVPEAAEEIPEDEVIEEITAEETPGEVGEEASASEDDVIWEVPEAEETPAESGLTDDLFPVFPEEPEVSETEETPAEAPAEQIEEEIPVTEEEQPEEAPAEEENVLDQLEEIFRKELGSEDEALGELDLDVPEVQTAAVERPYSPEVIQIGELYRFLDRDFIEEMFLKNQEFSNRFPADTLIRMSHVCKFADTAVMREFEKIAVNNGYAAEEVNEHQTVISRKMFTQDGSILSDIFNVANQVAALRGTYDSYQID